MATYLIKRVLQTIPVILGVIVFTFILMYVVPGDPVLSMVGERTIMATVFDDRTTVGMVRLYAKSACERMEKIFGEIGTRPANKATLDAEFGDSARGALDFFFSE